VKALAPYLAAAALAAGLGIWLDWLTVAIAAGVAFGLALIFGRAAPATAPGHFFCYLFIAVSLIALLGIARTPPCPADDIACQLARDRR
jgi:hypothetical protein